MDNKARTRVVTLKLTERQLRWVISQLETSFETPYLSPDEAKAMHVLGAALLEKKRRSP
jgi:hypothetical protein